MFEIWKICTTGGAVLVAPRSDRNRAIADCRALAQRTNRRFTVVEVDNGTRRTVFDTDW